MIHIFSKDFAGNVYAYSFKVMIRLCSSIQIAFRVSTAVRASVPDEAQS